MWLFALPALLINVFIILIPATLTFAAAFVVWDGVGTPVWAGLANFQHMFDDPVFWSALTNNFIWTAIFLTVPVCIALVMAAALLMAPASRVVVQIIIFLPRILAVAVTGRIFQGMIFSPATGVVAWLTIVFRGYMPAGVYNALFFTASWNARVTSYLTYLTDAYPPVGDEGEQAGDHQLQAAAAAPSISTQPTAATPPVDPGQPPAGSWRCTSRRPRSHHPIPAGSRAG